MNIMFGGSFNPVTLAHEEIIKELRKKFNPTNIIIMPTGNSYTWKALDNFNDRFEMLKLALPDTIISDYENKNTYKGTLSTLDFLSKDYPDLYFCMGADNLYEFYRWINYETILEKYNIIVFTRKGYNALDVVNEKYFKYKDKFHFLELDIDISSSKIRNDVDLYKDLLNKKVYDYIKKNSLYERRINMFNHDFLKVCAITPKLEVGNPKYNIKEILNALNNCYASVAVFPELCVTGYTCNDLFFQRELLNDSAEAIDYFLHNNKFKGIVTIGAPLSINGSLYNCAFVIKENRILGIVPKRSLPNNKEYYEKRFFKSSLNNEMTEVFFNGFKIPFGNIIFRDDTHGLNIGVEICEDMWASVTPSNIMAQYGANLILNLSASNETFGKSDIRRNTVLENSRRNCGAYVYASAGALESTSETVYSGHNIIASLGNLVTETENFCTDTEFVYGDIDLGEIKFKRRMNTNLHDDFKLNYKAIEVQFELLESDDYKFENKIDDTPFVPKDNVKEAFEKISQIQEYALYKRMLHTKAESLVIGVSGGLDSTLALLVAIQTFKKLNKDPKDIIAVTMPSFATSDRTHSNANLLMKGLGVTVKEIPIENISLSVFDAIGQNKDNHDVTYENTQARIRTLLLMNIANKTNGLVLGTGDLSELALGWCTYNGDQMSMYGINAGVPKTLVRFLTKQYGVYKYIDLASILNDIIDTPISPELSNQNQSTEDSIGKYEINDFILNRFLAYGDDKERISFLLKKTFNMSDEDINKNVSNFFRRFFSQQFKRQALPDGPKVLDISLSPRSDFRMPSDISRK